MKLMRDEIRAWMPSTSSASIIDAPEAAGGAF